MLKNTDFCLLSNAQAIVYIMLINAKMQTNVCILALISMINFALNELSMKKYLFYILVINLFYRVGPIAS